MGQALRASAITLKSPPQNWLSQTSLRSSGSDTPLSGDRVKDPGQGLPIQKDPAGESEAAFGVDGALGGTQLRTPPCSVGAGPGACAEGPGASQEGSQTRGRQRGLPGVL